MVNYDEANTFYSHCGDTRSGSLSSLVDALDELPLFPTSVFDRDPVSDGFQVGWDPRIVSGFNEVVETGLEFLDNPSRHVRENVHQSAWGNTYSLSPRIAATVIALVLNSVTLGCSPAGYSKPKRFTSGRYMCYVVLVNERSSTW